MIVLGAVIVLLLAAVLAVLLTLLFSLNRELGRLEGLEERAVKALEGLSARREAVPAAESTEEDARRSRAVEDGIASILQYAAGKVPGVEVEL